MGIATVQRPRIRKLPAESTNVPAATAWVSRKTRVRARGNLILGVCAFLGIQLFLFGLLQWREHLRDPIFGDKKRRLEQTLTQYDHPFLLLALGSSRTGMGFHGEMVSNHLTPALGRPVVAFNFGIPAVGPVLQLTYLKRLLAEGVKPNLLLLEVHPAMLTNELGEPIEKRGLFVEQLRLSEIFSIQNYHYLNENAERDWWGANLIPTHGSRFALLGRLLPNWLPGGIRFDWGRRTDPWGWNAASWVNPSRDLREMGIRKAREEYESMLTNLTFESAPIDALRQILAISKTNEIPVVLLLMPEGPLFRSWYPETVTRRLEAFIASLETPCINARDWVAEEDFLDSHHLLQTGARHFSEQLGGELQRILESRDEAFPRPKSSRSLK